MLKNRLTQNRADRVNAIGRVVLAVPTLLTTVLDPPQPARFAATVTGLLVGYVVLATGFALWVWLRRLSAPPLGAIAHAVDLAVIAALVYLTTGASSPFFPLYIFAILAATLKWNWRGALWTTAVTVALFIPTGFLADAPLDPAQDEVLRYVIRVGQLIVIGGLLAYLGAQRERWWQELLQLSQPVNRVAGTLDDVIAACLVHVSQFFDAPRTLLLWESREEPGWRSTEYQKGMITPVRRPLPGSQPPVASAAKDIAFNYVAGADDCRQFGAEGELQRIEHPLLAAATAETLQIERAIIIAISSDALTGWLVIPGLSAEEDLYLGRALAVQLAAALDHGAATIAWGEAAASEERLRLAGDLHDGVLQFLTGLALQLKLIDAANGKDSAAVASRVRNLTEALRVEHRELRSFIENIRPGAGEERGNSANLPLLARQLAEQWNVAVTVNGAAEPPARLSIDVRQMLREAVANAVRHGGAGNITVNATAHPMAYQLEIGDDGKGFAHEGRFSGEALSAAQQGPRSIMGRVARLGGTFWLNTGPGRTMIDINLPRPDTQSQ